MFLAAFDLQCPRKIRFRPMTPAGAEMFTMQQ